CDYTARGWPLGHLWSLAVEEQFYLLWPFTLKTLGPKRSVRVLLGILALAPVLRLLTPYAGSALNFLIWSDALATGCLLSLLRDELAAHKSYSRLLSSRWFVLVPIAAVAANYVPFTKLYWVMSEPLMNLTIAACADWAMRNSGSVVGRFLNLPAVGFLGVLSYSLYLWQQIFLDRYSARPFCTFPLNLVLAFTMALLSYVLIEAPFLRIRAAIERARATPGAGRGVPSRVNAL
ncbi:MAG: acyltransferase family protein, partial [Terriglobia bacterium]